MEEPLGGAAATGATNGGKRRLRTTYRAAKNPSASDPNTMNTNRSLPAAVAGKKARRCGCGEATRWPSGCGAGAIGA